MSTDLIAVTASMLAYDNPSLLASYHVNKRGSSDTETAFIRTWKAEPKYICDEVSGAQGYLFETEINFVIAFRGTDSLIDVFQDVNANLVPFAKFACKVHAGSYHQFTRLNALFDTKTCESKPLIVTGHSLGSMLALLFSLYYCKLYTSISYIGFGSPKVGDGAFVSKILTDVTSCKQYKFGCDPITALMIGDDYAMTTKAVHYGSLDPFPDIPIMTKLPDHHILNYVNAIANNEPVTDSENNWWWHQLSQKIQFFIEQVLRHS